MSDGLLAIPPILPAGISTFQAIRASFHESLVIQVRTEPAEDLAVRRLLGELTPTELMAEIVAMDGGLDVVR
jgi:hypothetical protein